MTSYPIEGPWPGGLAIVPRPRGGDWLEDEVRALRNEGFDVVVSLLTREEVDELSLLREAELMRTYGLKFCNYPIRDLGVPDSRESFRRFLEGLQEDLQAGKKIAVHCRGSIGRSGLVVASVLVMSGIDPEQAFIQVTAARGFSAPETEEQKEWVRTLATEAVRSLA